MFYFSLIFIPFPFFCLHLRWFPVRLGLPIRLWLSIRLGLPIRLGLSVGLRLSVGGSCGSCCCHVRVVHNSGRLLSLLWNNRLNTWDQKVKLILSIREHLFLKFNFFQNLKNICFKTRNSPLTQSELLEHRICIKLLLYMFYEINFK